MGSSPCQRRDDADPLRAPSCFLAIGQYPLRTKRPAETIVMVPTDGTQTVWVTGRVQHGPIGWERAHRH